MNKDTPDYNIEALYCQREFLKNRRYLILDRVSAFLWAVDPLEETQERKTGQQLPIAQLLVSMTLTAMISVITKMQWVDYSNTVYLFFKQRINSMSNSEF